MAPDEASSTDAELRDETLVTTDEDQLFLVESGRLRPILDSMTLHARGLDLDEIRHVPHDVLVGWTVGEPLPVPDVIEETLDSNLGGRRYMTTTAKLSRADGTMEITTRTRTGKHWEGFTGGVQVYVVRPDGIRGSKTQWYKYGVNGKKLAGAHDRTETQILKIDPAEAKTATGIVITHAHKPEIQKRLDEFYENTEKVADLVEKGVSIGAKISGMA